MTRWPLAFLAASVPCLALCGAAVPPVPKESGIPITADNAHLVRSVKEVPKRANRFTRGPQRGELILLDWNAAAEVVHDTDLRSLRPLAKGYKPTDVAVSPGGKHVAWTERNRKSYTLQETATGKTLDVEVGDTPGYASFSPDGTILAIGKTFWDPNAHGVGHSELNLYDLSGKLLRTLGKTGPGAVHPCFSPDGKILAVGNRNHETLLFEAATGKLLHTLEKRMIQEIAFSPNGKTLAAGYVDGTFALWDVATGTLLHSAPSSCREVYSVDWSPKGDLLATSGRDGKIVLWEPGKFTRLKELDAPAWVIRVRFTADGTRLLTASAAEGTATSDRKMVFWEVPAGAGR